MGTVRFGVCGWDYKDWQGPLYPAPLPRGFRALPLLARFLDFKYADYAAGSTMRHRNISPGNRNIGTRNRNRSQQMTTFSNI